MLNPLPYVDVKSLTPEIFAEKYQRTGTPVVITGLLEQECDWNLEYLCEKLGDREFLFRYYGRDRYKQDKRQWKNIGSGVNMLRMPFTEYAEMLRNRKAHEDDIYLAKASINNTALADTQFLKIIGKQLGLTRPGSKLLLYMGPGGHTASLHYDSMDGTLMQLHGSKKVVLFPPSQTNNLYPFPIHIHFRHGLNMRCWYSQVSLENPDLQSFPKFQEALQFKYDVLLHQGEILYIPSGWWHEVTTLGDEMVCSVTQFWRVYPTLRAVFNRNRWRAGLGNICAIPYLSVSLTMTVFSRDRTQKLGKLLYKL
uniref:Transcription factor jumonji jmjC domain-containing protein n=1 Tax=Tolypothrix bouteillei VB521301 TaxID=1479485 RepID=A0A0C1N283_9CYAN